MSGVVKSQELLRRVAVAAVGIPLVLVCLRFGGWLLGGLVAGVAGLAVREFYRLAETRGMRPFSMLGTAGAVAAVLVATANPTPAEAGPPLVALAVGLVLVCLGASVWLREPGTGGPLSAAGVTLAGVLYVGVTLAFVPMLRWLPATAPGALTGNAWHASGFVLLPLLAIWVGDSAAYFVGSAAGRRQLAPSVSPGKTLEGAVAGLAGSTLAAAAVSWWALARFPFLTVPVATAAWMGLVLGAAAQVGDLAESVLKRDAGVKDSGSLLPGHGGFLDRLDALLFAFPTAWALLELSGVLP